MLVCQKTSIITHSWFFISDVKVHSHYIHVTKSKSGMGKYSDILFKKLRREIEI